eukprot:3212983-Pyramimonas_sp.AAC.1
MRYPHWGLTWSSLWDHEALYCVWRTHVVPPPVGPSVELPMGPQSAVLGVADACGTPARGGGTEGGDAGTVSSNTTGWLGTTWKPALFQNVALAFAPRAFALEVCSGFKAS